MTARGRGRIVRIVAVVGLVVVALGIIGFLWWAQPQPLLPEAEAALSSTPTASFEQGDDGRLTWTATEMQPTAGLVLYTGGKVPPAAYAPAARSIAEAGYLVAIVPAPFNFAIFDTDAAAAVIEDHPDIVAWAVGGHSLGGASAALFIDGHPGIVHALVLWASYSSADLSADGLDVLSAYGTLDGGVPTFTDPTNVANLGPAVEPLVIEGGNHEQMGWYTGQPDDPPATITREAQQSAVVEGTISLMDQLSPTD